VFTFGLCTNLECPRVPRRLVVTCGYFCRIV
jgi:hypothetical protein